MDLLQSQIKKSCTLALPEGLKDLMSDISREVLRARPNNIPQFIANYLGVLLEVREKLSIACHVCTETCKIICEPELYKELKAIGLSEESIDIVVQIVEEHWDQRNVKEQSILIKLAEKISIDEMQLPLIQDVIQKAIKLHHFKDGVPDGSKNIDDKVTDGVHHTLDRYRQNKTTTEEVFKAQNFDPCQDASDNEKEYGSFDYSLYSTATGRVKFEDEKIVFKSDGNNEYGYDKNTDDEDDDDYIADDVINEEEEVIDNDIEENIKFETNDDSASSVDEDFLV